MMLHQQRQDANLKYSNLICQPCLGYWDNTSTLGTICTKTLDSACCVMQFYAGLQSSYCKYTKNFELNAIQKNFKNNPTN